MFSWCGPGGLHDLRPGMVHCIQIVNDVRFLYKVDDLSPAK
jgi:hypothetical protein